MGDEADAVCGVGYDQRIFPVLDALIWLASAVPAEQRDEWTEMRRYIGRDVTPDQCDSAVSSMSARDDTGSSDSLTRI